MDTRIHKRTVASRFCNQAVDMFVYLFGIHTFVFFVFLSFRLDCRIEQIVVLERREKRIKITVVLLFPVPVSNGIIRIFFSIHISIHNVCAYICVVLFRSQELSNKFLEFYPNLCSSIYSPFHVFVFAHGFWVFSGIWHNQDAFRFCLPMQILCFVYTSFSLKQINL